MTRERIDVFSSPAKLVAVILNLLSFLRFSLSLPGAALLSPSVGVKKFILQILNPYCQSTLATSDIFPPDFDRTSISKYAGHRFADWFHRTVVFDSMA